MDADGALLEHHQRQQADLLGPVPAHRAPRCRRAVRRRCGGPLPWPAHRDDAAAAWREDGWHRLPAPDLVLMKKSGAFARYRYREELFPTLVFPRAFDALVSTHGDRADVEYVCVLHLPASTMKYTVEAALVEQALRPRGREGMREATEVDDSGDAAAQAGLHRLRGASGGRCVMMTKKPEDTSSNAWPSCASRSSYRRSRSNWAAPRRRRPRGASGLLVEAARRQDDGTLQGRLPRALRQRPVLWPSWSREEPRSRSARARW